MNRYRSAGPQDDSSMTEGDDGFVGVDGYTTPENLPPGLAQSAVNIDFSTADAKTRGGFVCLPELGISPFELTWTARSAAAASTWQRVAFGNSLFVAVATTGATRVQSSSDGTTWTAGTAAAAEPWQDICYGNNLFVAVANSATAAANAVMTSSDAVLWTSRTATGNYLWYGVAYGNGTYVAVGYSGANTSRIMSSTDGTTWTARTPSSATGNWISIAYGNGVFVAVSAESGVGGVMTSPDGTTWTTRTPASASIWNSVTFGNGTFVAVGNGGAVMTSTNGGATWTSRTAAANNDWMDVAYGASMFTAVGMSGTGNRAMVSRDGISWVSNDSAEDNQWIGVAYGNSVFAAVAQDGSNRVMTAGTSASTFASGVYSDPNEIGSDYIMLAKRTGVSFYAFGKTSKTVNYTSGETVSALSTIVQANNKVYIFRGSSATPLVWEGSWAAPFELATGTIVSTDMAVFAQNRLWCKNGKDTISASDVLDFTAFNALSNSVNIGKGDSAYTVTLYPFGETTMLVFKNRSIVALTNIDGSLSDIVATEITRQLGAIGINSVVSVGPDLVYVSDRNVNLLSLTQTNNALQHKTLPLSTPIKGLMDRVNWEYGYKISIGYWDNKIYVALPLDNSTVCNAVAVYNFVTEKWYGEWDFDSNLGMAIQGWQVANYLGLQRLHAITEDGRIFVTDEGSQDISGTNFYPISTSLTTRAYRMDNANRLNRRMFADLSTRNPEFSVTAYVDGASEGSVLLTDQTFLRSQSWIFGDSSYSLTNSGDDYNRAGRKDYTWTVSDNVQCRSGFLPEMMQDYRYPLLFRRAGRLVWFEIENTLGKISINGTGGEARPGARSNYVQVI